MTSTTTTTARPAESRTGPYWHAVPPGEKFTPDKVLAVARTRGKAAPWANNRAAWWCIQAETMALEGNSRYAEFLAPVKSLCQTSDDHRALNDLLVAYRQWLRDTWAAKAMDGDIV